MASFRFRLATLQRLREQVRDERRGRLVEAQRALDILQQQQQELDGEIAAATDETRRSAQPGAVDVDRLQWLHRHDQTLRTQRDELSRQATTLTDEIEIRRQALAAAERDVKVLEKLHERLALRHDEAAAAVAAKELDEVATRGFVRREEPSWAD